MKDRQTASVPGKRVGDFAKACSAGTPSSLIRIKLEQKGKVSSR